MPDHQGQSYDDSDDVVTISPFAVAAVLLRGRRLLLGLALAGLAAGLAAALLRTPTYEAVAKFVTSQAAQAPAPGVGADLNPAQGRDPGDYYRNLLSSRAIQQAVLAHTLPNGETIASRIGVPASDPAAGRARLLGAYARLESSRSWTTSAFPVWMIRAEWTDPEVAADVANAYLEALRAHDLQIRSTAAGQRRSFVESRIEETGKALADAEAALRVFREENRLLLRPVPREAAGTPPVPAVVQQRHEQLQRDVQIQADLYLSLKKAFDSMRIAELSEASPLIVLDHAAPRRTPLGWSFETMVWLGLAAGLVVGLIVVAATELWRRVDLTTPDAHDLVGEWQDLRTEVRTLAARVSGPALEAPKPSTTPQKQDA